MRTPQLAVVLVSLVTTTQPAEACRMFEAPDALLVRGHASGAISGAALVRITDAKYIGPVSGDAHPWRASATVGKVLVGAYASKHLSFERGWGSSACDDGRPAPKAGDLWVTYFWKRGPEDQPIWKTYPAKVAFAADPKLRRP